MKNNNLFKLSLLAFSVLGIAGCSHAEPTKIEEDPIVFETGDIKSSGLAVQRLISGADSNNHPYQTFSYETVPVNSPYSDIDVTTAFVNGTSCSDYVTTQHDASNKTITLTCLQPFNRVIKLHLEAHYKSSVYADVTVRYLPKYTQDISRTLIFYKEDPQNPGNYIETTTTEAFLNAFSFDVSVNTENVLSNPKEGVQIDGGGIVPFYQSSPATFPYILGGDSPSSEDYIINNSGMLGGDSFSDFNDWFNNSNGLYPNNFSSSFKNIMTATGFDRILHRLMIRVMVNTSSTLARGLVDYSGFANFFRSRLLQYLTSQRIDIDLTFDNVNTKLALVNAINDWMESNSFYYVYFCHIDFFYVKESDRSTSYTVPLLYGNGDTDTFDGQSDNHDVVNISNHDYGYGYFKAAKFVMPEPLTLAELSPSSISAESTDIYF